MAYNIYLPITCVDCGTWWLQSDCLWCNHQRRSGTRQKANKWLLMGLAAQTKIGC